MPTNSLPVPSPSLGVYRYYNLDMRTFCEQNFTIVSTSTFIRGNSRCRFLKRWKWQICHAHWAFPLPLRTLSGKLQTFHTVKSKTIRILFDRIQRYTPVHFGKSPRELLPEKEQLSGHYAAYSEVDGTCYTTRCTWLHYVRFENQWKRLAERLLVLQTCVSHHTLVEGSRDKTEHFC